MTINSGDCVKWSRARIAEKRSTGCCRVPAWWWRELPVARHLHTNKPGPLIFQPSLSTGSSWPASNRPLTRRYNHSLELLSFVITNRNNSFIIKAGPSATRNPAGTRSRGFNDVDSSPGSPVSPNVSWYSSKKNLRFGVRTKKARLSRTCRRWFSFFPRN